MRCTEDEYGVLMCVAPTAAMVNDMNNVPTPSLRHRLSAVALATSLGFVAVLSSAAPAAAVEFAPAATVEVTATCVDGTFHLDITMGNLQGLTSAHFVASASTSNTGWSDIPIDVAAGDASVSHLTSAEGSAVTVHITSTDAAVPIDYSLAVTADCVEDTTIPDTTIPETTVVDSSGGGLPSTGGSNWLMAGVASALLLAGITLTRSTRRA